MSANFAGRIIMLCFIMVGSFGEDNDVADKIYLKLEVLCVRVSAPRYLVCLVILDSCV